MRHKTFLVGLTALLVALGVAVAVFRMQAASDRYQPSNAIPVETRPNVSSDEGHDTNPSRRLLPQDNNAVVTWSSSRKDRRDTPLEQRYAESTDKHALFVELTSMTGKDRAGALYFAARILQDCADATVGSVERRISSFLQNIPADDPNRSARIHAFERLKKPCSAFQGTSITKEAIETLFLDAAELGDTRALAHIAASWGVQSAVPIDAASALIKILDAGEAEAMPDIGAFLGRMSDGPVIDGRPVAPKNRAAADAAWILLSCSKGGNCGPNSSIMLLHCAQQSVCSLGSVQELLQEVMLTSEQYKLAHQYAKMIDDALQRRDYASLGIVVGKQFAPSPSN